MSRTSLLLLAVLGLFTFAGFALVPDAVGQGKDDAPDKVKFETPDGVKIHGDFYRSPKKGAPAVIMLHNIGEVSTKEKWIDLAKALQPSFSVLTFDFRGHGNSTEIDPDLYFKYPANVKHTRGAAATKRKLDWKEIDKSAYTLFINDIAAAKSYLERTKNDLGQCNTQNTIVIGVEQSATLAAIWANSEWYRYKIDFPPPFFQIRPEAKSEGQYLSALVFLSISPKLGTRPINLIRTLEYPCRQNMTPTLFVHGDGDPKDKESIKDKEIARSIEKSIKFGMTKKDLEKLQYTKAVELKKAGKLRGIDLLAKSLNTAQGISGYLNAVVNEDAREWSQRDFVKSKFAWKLSANPNDVPIPAKIYNYDSPFPPSPIFPPGTIVPDAVERNLAFNTYEIFIPQ